MKNFFGVIIFCLFVAIAYLPLAGASAEITGRRVEMEDHDDHVSFVFMDDVHVNGTDFNLNADWLEVISEKSSDCPGHCRSKIKNLHATGNVYFEQLDRTGRADEIVVVPDAQVMYLIGRAEITDVDGTVRGDKLVLDKNSRSIKVESDGRSTVSISPKDKSADMTFRLGDEPDDEKKEDKK